MNWFTGERIDRLRAVAQSWLGTPFFANSCEKGRGVSCQKLVAAIYRECGFCDVQVPEVSMSHARFARADDSLVEKFMATQPQFVLAEQPLAGDLLGFRIGRVCHHLGIALDGGQFIHAYPRIGTTVIGIGDPFWKNRLMKVWRPV